MPKTLFAHILALATVFVWGITYVSSKVLLETLTPPEIAFFRFVLGLCMLFILRPHIFRHGLGLKGEAMFAGCGFFGVALYFVMENTALVYTYASNVSVIVCTVPFCTGLAAAFFLKEKLHPGFFSGFAVAMVGIAVISFSGSTELGLNPLGDALAFGGSLTWAAYTVLTRKIFAHNFPIIESTRRMLLWGTAMLGLYLLIQPRSIHFPNLSDAKILANLIFLGPIASAVCYLTWNEVLRTLGAITPTLYIYLTPAITVLFAIIVLGENLTVYSATGMLLTVAGVMLSEKTVIIEALRARKIAQKKKE